jgi:hypothetical protein
MIGPEQVVSDERREQRRNGVIWLAVALILVMSLGVAYRQDHRADDTDKKLDASGQQVETLKGQVQVNGNVAQSALDAATEANRRLAAAGKPTVPVPSVAPVSPATSAPATSLSVEDVRTIVGTELARQKIALPQSEVQQIARVAAQLVPKPADGKTPTPAEIQPRVTAAIAAYCVDDKCVGKPGVVGPKGDPGDKGEPGVDAPKVTDAELLAAAQQALAAYCASDGKPCDGTPGVDGKDGQNGADAPVITDFDCVGNGNDSYWRIQFDKGPDKTALGPCRVTVIPPPPTPTDN